VVGLASLALAFAAMALAAVGHRYVWGGIGPYSWDCSGIGYDFFGHIGIRIPRTADEQYHASYRLPKGARLHIGDHVCFMDSRGHVYHIAWYVGKGWVVEARGRLYGVHKYAANWYSKRPGYAGWYRFKGIDLEPEPVVIPPTPTLPAKSVLQVGSRGNAVKTLQQSLGVYPAGGRFHESLKEAVVDMQKALGAAPDGRVNPTLFAYISKPPKLRKGSVGAWVRVLRRMLDAPPDGPFNDELVVRVKNFQRKNKLVYDGEVGPSTWTVLKRREK
jgi:hypothetical protein